MDEQSRDSLYDVLRLASAQGAITFLGLAALVGELRRDGAISEAAALRIRSFILHAVDTSDATHDGKHALRAMVAANIQGM